jgi:tetratricopeptide (TPR) repeat protein
MLNNLKKIIIAIAIAIYAINSHSTENKETTTPQAPQKIAQHQNTSKETPTNQEQPKITTKKATENTEILEEKIEKKIESLNRKIENQDRIIEIQNEHFDNGLSILGIFLGVLTLILTAAGITSYFTIHNKAEREARLAANDWFETNTKKFNLKIVELEEKLSEIETTANDHFKTHVQRVSDGAESAIKQMQDTITKQDKSEKIDFKLLENEEEALAQAASSAALKPTDRTNFEDWNKRAFNAYAQKDKENATKHWRMALEKGTDNKQDIVQTLLNIAQTELDIKKYDKSIKACDEAIAKSKEINTPESDLATAQAILIKSICCFELGLFEEAIEQHNILINEFSKNNDPEVQKILVHSKTRSSMNLGSLGKYEEAIENSEKILSELSSQNEKVATRNILSRVTNNLAFNLICLAKRDWDNKEKRISSLNSARIYALNSIVNDQKNPIPHGNLVYCDYLLGASLEQTKTKFDELFKISDDRFYDATLKDLEIHPVPEKDPVLKRLLIKT